MEKKRYIWVSIVLSLLIPGMGQLYNGQTRKALVLLILNFTALFSMIVLFSSFAGAVVLIFLVLFIYLFALIDAAYYSRKLKNLSLTRYNRWFVYLLIIVINLGTTVARLVVVPFYSCKIVEAGMLPTIKPGDQVIADIHWYRSKRPQRGDIVVFRCPEDRSQSFIQRVIGLPHETLEIKDKQVFINGQRLEESYVQHVDEAIWPGEHNPRDNLALVTIPDNALFLLGDNRDSSLDSRFWQCIEFEDLQGKILYIYWSSDRTQIGKTVK
jgi:signal peptidase I